MAHFLTYRIQAYAGWDLRLYLYPSAAQARTAARILLRGVWRGLTQAALDETAYNVELPNGRAYRLRDLYGAVEPSRADPLELVITPGADVKRCEQA